MGSNGPGGEGVLTVRHGLDRGRLAGLLLRRLGALGLEQVREEERVDKGRLAQAGAAHDHHVELEPALECARLQLRAERVKANVARQARLMEVINSREREREQAN